MTNPDRARTPKFDERIKTDLEYIDDGSLGLDLEILARTITPVLCGRGAY
jgi:lipopolysaccharide/colanic/teichoic acid biosynthesis glycosyltransferase